MKARFSIKRGSLALIAGLTLLSVHSAVVQAAATDTQVEVDFSPEGSAQRLVLQTIHEAHRSIRLAGYSFTSPEVVRGLIDAKHRGVDVAIVVDAKANLSEGGKGAHALSALVTAGIPVRTISVYPIHHDKYIVTDGANVETGSFNYSQAAANRNSENVLVIRNNPDLAARYLAQWESRWKQGQDFKAPY